MEPSRPNRPLIAQAGGIIAAICFFLPWGSCQGSDLTSGLQLGGSAWLVLAAAVGIVGGVFFFQQAGTPSKARRLVIVSALVGLAVMFLKYLKARNQFGAFFTVELGGVCGFGGFLLALFGSRFLTDPAPSHPPRQTSDDRVPDEVLPDEVPPTSSMDL